VSANNAAYGDEAPIAALATPLAETALALIRCSGKETLRLVAKVFSRPKQLLKAPGGTFLHGWIVDGQGKRIDEILVSVYRAPHSYTGEEGVDISCHGGTAVVRSILRVLGEAGFREALRGEFTFRAFMNKKLDLTRAESVMEVVCAKTDHARELAVHRLSGALEREISAVKALLVQVLAGLELLLDYSEDEAGVPDPDGLPDSGLAREAFARIQALARSYGVEKLYRDGAMLVIGGPPNAGKSSLFNRLIREERSIVTDIPGTTRDWVEAAIAIENIPLRLIDTAGLRDAADPLERLGVERSLSLIEEADLILYLIDGACGIRPEDRAFIRDHADRPLLTVWSKADCFPPPPECPVAASAETGIGIDRLCTAIAARLAGSPPSGAGVGIAAERQKACIDAAQAAVAEALCLADERRPLDLIAPLFREAVNALGEITGEVSSADILEAVFSRFCVGK
jgi:tRNA modification GTPase